MRKRKALVLGASGLVGREVVKRLLDNSRYDNVTLLVRKEIDINSKKLVQIKADFDNLDFYEDLFLVDDIFSCLGTTIKKAKSKEAFRRVDYDYTIQAADLAEKMGAKQFLTISSMGASSKSPFFYSKVKGQVEETLRKKPDIGIHIFRPSLLLGDRKEFRLGERAAEVFMKPMKYILVGPFKKYRAIKAKTVAKAMVITAVRGYDGYHIYESNEIEAIAKKK